MLTRIAKTRWLSAVVGLVVAGAWAASSAHAQHGPWFFKRPCQTCPDAASPYSETPLIQPQDMVAPAPGAAPTPALAAVTTAALVPNMFGDRFGGSSYTVSFRDNFTFTGQAFVGPGGGNAQFTNLLPITTSRGITILPGQSFTSVQSFTSPFDPPPAHLDMQDNPAVRTMVVGPQGIFVDGDGVFVPPPPNGGPIIDGSTYIISYVYEGLFNVVNPSQGVVGRAKISEDNSPIPRDRLIFNYDFFSNAAVSRAGWDVQRFTVGLEKTFFNQLCSLEVRLPIASTLDSDLQIGGQSTSNTEIGNLRMIFKALLWNSQEFHLAAGMGLDLPTGDDTRVLLPGGFELMRIENKAFILMPYIGSVYTPTERCFLQTWLSMEFDANGNPVLVAGNQGLSGIGRLNDATFLVADAQLGYWLYLSETPGRFLQGLAPFVELHYGTTVENADFASGDGVVVRNNDNRNDELNITAGLVMLLGNNATLSMGAIVPLRNDEGDRGFDYQVGMRLSWLFGPSTRVPRTVAALN